MSTEVSTEVSTAVRAITGRTTLCAILADPILHVKTPDAINNLLRERGAASTIFVVATVLLMWVGNLAKGKTREG